MPECALLRLRALLGISARAEIIIYLCTHGPAHPSWIARETGFSQKNVQDTLVAMVASHVVHVGKLEGRKKSYFITNHDKATLLHDPVHPPIWVTWSPLFRAVEIMWLKLLDLETEMPSPFLFSSQLRHLKIEFYKGIRGSRKPPKLALSNEIEKEILLTLISSDIGRLRP